MGGGAGGKFHARLQKIIYFLTISQGKVNSEWLYWNRIIWPWAYSLYKKNVNFEIKWTLQNIISKVNYSDEIFKEQLRAIKFLDCSTYNCENDVYQDFVTKF